MPNPFTFDWDKTVDDAERDALLTRIADTIRRRGLQTPAIWFLEIHRPLFPLGGQFAIALSPFLGVFFSGGAFDMQKYTKLMQSPANVEQLIRLIDAPEPFASSSAEAGASP